MSEINKKTLQTLKAMNCVYSKVFAIDKDLSAKVKEFVKTKRDLTSIGLIFNYKNMNHVQAIKVVAEAIADKIAIIDVSLLENQIVIHGRLRKSKKFTFPEKDDHFDRSKDRYQFHTFMLACSFLTQKRTAIDIGGHIGLYSAAMLDTFQDVIAFEPSPNNIECFKKNSPNAKLIECGLGDEDKKVILNVAEDNSGNSSIVEEFSGKKISIDIKTLDSFNLNNIDLIKIDIQGYEAQALVGAKDTIKRNKPIIIIELITHKNSPPNQEAIKLLKSFDYKILDIIGKDYIWGPSE